jgi:hypothetical protein
MLLLNIFRLTANFVTILFQYVYDLLHMTSSYQQQLDAKIERITAQFTEFAHLRLKFFNLLKTLRAEFRIWHTEEDMFYAMLERDEDNQKKVFVLMTSQLLMPVLISSCLFYWQN